MARPKGSKNKSKKTVDKLAEVEGYGDAAIFLTILEEAENYGENVQIPTRDEIKQRGVDGNFYRGDFYELANPASRWQLFKWAPPTSPGDRQAYSEKAKLDDPRNGWREVIAHPENGPFHVANRFRKDEAYRVFDGVKQLFARPIDHYIEQRAKNSKIADNKFNTNMDKLYELADALGLDVEEVQEGMKQLKVNNLARRARNRIYSR